VPFAHAGALSLLIKFMDEKMEEDPTQEPPNFTWGPTCPSVLVALSLRSLLCPLLIGGALSCLINLKDEKMKEDATKEPSNFTRGPTCPSVHVALSLRSLLCPSPRLAHCLVSLK
jgi:hypothetical protein